jgi:hypothetical protein
MKGDVSQPLETTILADSIINFALSARNKRKLLILRVHPIHRSNRVLPVSFVLANVALCVIRFYIHLLASP